MSDFGAEAKIRNAVSKALATAPPLTRQQRDRIAALLQVHATGSPSGGLQSAAQDAQTRLQRERIANAATAGGDSGSGASWARL